MSGCNTARRICGHHRRMDNFVPRFRVQDVTRCWGGSAKAGSVMPADARPCQRSRARATEQQCEHEHARAQQRRHIARLRTTRHCEARHSTVATHMCVVGSTQAVCTTGGVGCAEAVVCVAVDEGPLRQAPVRTDRGFLSPPCHASGWPGMVEAPAPASTPALWT